MSAAIEADAQHMDEYPERISIRLTSALSKSLYDELNNAQERDGVNITLRLLALVDLCWVQASPEQREQVVQRAQQMGWETRQRSLAKLSRSWERRRQKQKAAQAANN